MVVAQARLPVSEATAPLPDRHVDEGVGAGDPAAAVVDLAAQHQAGVAGPARTGPRPGRRPRSPAGGRPRRRPGARRPGRCPRPTASSAPPADPDRATIGDRRRPGGRQRHPARRRRRGGVAGHRGAEARLVVDLDHLAGGAVRGPGGHELHAAVRRAAGRRGRAVEQPPGLRLHDRRAARPGAGRRVGALAARTRPGATRSTSTTSGPSTSTAPATGTLRLTVGGRWGRTRRRTSRPPRGRDRRR